MTTTFVYGTLMQGMRNHLYLESAKLVGPAKTKPEFELMYNGSIPAARPGSESIVGEVYELDDATLAKLDEVEEVSSKLYTKQDVELENSTKAVIYLGGERMFATDTWEHVPDGDFRKLRENQKTA